MRSILSRLFLYLSTPSQWEKDIKMKMTKTNANGKTKYIYYDAMGNLTTVTAGLKGVTEIHIKELYNADNREAYNNLKNSKTPLTDNEKVQVKEWEKNHPGQVAEKHWHKTIDYSYENEDSLDKSKCIYEASLAANKDVSPDIERLREVVNMFTDDEKYLYSLYMAGFNFVEIGKILGISRKAANRRFDRIKEKIKKLF